MTGYSFQEGVPSGLEFDFDSGLFHNPQHLQLQSVHGWHSYVMLNDVKKSVVALLHVHIEKKNAVSPLRSPYGSILLSETLSSELLKQFIISVEAKLQEKGVKRLTFKCAPDIYTPHESNLLHKVFSSQGYESTAEKSAVIPVTTNKFESTLHLSAKKRLRKCKDSGFKFNELSLENVTGIYQLLKAWREQKRYSMSMSLEALNKTMDVFPDAFLVTEIKSDDRVVAANISIQVNKFVLYNFYHDHDPEFDEFSPVILLNEGLYLFCQQRKLALLDLGTSQTDGKLNESLFNFKLKLGAQPSNKFTFAKNLA